MRCTRRDEPQDERSNESEPPANDNNARNGAQRPDTVRAEIHSHSIPPPDEICNLHTSSFKEIIGKVAFVDKTLFIKDIFGITEQFVCLTAPACFGKTTFLDMLRCFFSIEVNDKAQPLHNSGKNYRMFESSLLKICTWERAFFEAFCGRFPVIFLDFLQGAEHIKSSTSSKHFNLCQYTIQAAYREYSYLIKHTSNDKLCWNSERLTKSRFRPQTFVNFMTRKLESPDIPALTWACEFLCDVLYAHFRKPVIFLIDNYDCSILYACNDCNVKKETDIVWIMYLLPFVQNKTYCAKVVLSVQIPLFVLETCFTMYREYCPYTDRKSIRWVGFTNQEILELLAKPVFAMLNHDVITQWYGGYKTVAPSMGLAPNQNWYSQQLQALEDEMEVHHPWSVLSCLQQSVAMGEPCLEVYWPRSHFLFDYDKLFKLPTMEDIFIRLLNNQCVSENYHYFYVQNIQNLFKSVGKSASSLTSPEISMILQLLDCYGFLTKTNVDIHTKQFSFSIPNLERKKMIVTGVMKKIFQRRNHSIRLNSRLVWKY